MNIYFSSVAFKNCTIKQVGELAKANNLSIEFSANFQPNDRLLEDYLSLDINKIPHNYFPPPAIPFVLNFGKSKS